MHPRLTLFALLLAACGGTAATPDPTPGRAAEAPADDPALRSLLDAAGDDAAVTIFFHPRHWSVLSTVARELAGELMPDEVRVILEQAGPWAGAQLAAREEGMTIPESLAGWDERRPLVVALFETPEQSITALLDRGATSFAAPPYTHRVVVPATDPQRLAEALSALGRANGCRDAGADLLEVLGATRGVLRCDDLVVRVEPGDGFVRLRAALGPDRAAAAGPLGRPAREGAVVTPARRWATGGSVVLAAHLRPDRVRRAFLVETAGSLANALAYASPDVRTAMAATGRSEFLGQALRTMAVGAEVDDLSIGLATGLRPTFTIVHSLSEVGVTAFDAGAAATSSQIAEEGPTDAPFVVQTALDIDAIQAAAGPPLGFAGARDPDGVLRRVRECGQACYVQLLSSRVFGLGALADQVGLRAAIEGEVGPILRIEPAPLPPTVTMNITLDFPALVARMGEDMFTRLIASRVGVAHAIQAREGRTVMTTIRLGEVPEVPRPARIAFADPGPQSASYPRDDAVRCVETVTSTAEEALRALGSTPRSAWPAFDREFQRVLGPHGDCPAAAPPLRELVQLYLASFERLVNAPSAPE